SLQNLRILAKRVSPARNCPVFVDKKKKIAVKGARARRVKGLAGRVARARDGDNQTLGRWYVGHGIDLVERRETLAVVGHPKWDAAAEGDPPGIHQVGILNSCRMDCIVVGDQIESSKLLGIGNERKQKRCSKG